MSKVFILLLIQSFFVFPVFGQEIAEIKTIKINSKELNQVREILVSTPQSYKEHSNTYYDVIYVFDAHNREFFDYTHSSISFLSNGSRKFIVVGITSPYNEKEDYSRNNDFLPVLQSAEDKKRYGKYSGNAENFLKYIKNEVIPHIELNYRTLTHRTAIGHSLSASFLIYAMTNNTSQLFDNTIAISPNLAFDNERLVTDLKSFNFNTLKGNNYFFLSTASEANNWPEWKPANEKMISFLKNSINKPNLKIVVKEFPDESHWNTFAPSLNLALGEYFSSTYELQKKELSEELFEVTFKVEVPNKNDEVYITGNQEQLGDWKPNLVKLNRKSDYERELKIKVRSPLRFKFTKGGWESEAYVNNAPGDITIKPKSNQEYWFKIVGYKNN